VGEVFDVKLTARGLYTETLIYVTHALLNIIVFIRLYILL